MKNAKTYITGIILILAGAVVYYMYKNFFGRKPGEATPPAAKGGENNPTSSKNPLSLDSFPLKFGSKGENVILLQRALGGIIQDGIFGAMTEKALVNKLGSTSIDKKNLDALIALKKQTGETAILKASNIDALVVDVKTEAEASVILHNTYTPIWQTVKDLPSADLIDLADKYKSAYGKSLYKTISDLNFVPLQNDDNLILNRLEAAGKKV